MTDTDEPLTQAELAHYRSTLEKRRATLGDVAESGREAAGNVELDQTRVGRLSRMDALRSQAMAQEAERRRAAELQRIDAALARIDDGSFGWCLRCDARIASARLDADPSAPMCVNCAD